MSGLGWYMGLSDARDWLMSGHGRRFPQCMQRLLAQVMQLDDLLQSAMAERDMVRASHLCYIIYNVGLRSNLFVLVQRDVRSVRSLIGS